MVEMIRVLRRAVWAVVSVLPVAGWLYAQPPVPGTHPVRLESDRQYIALLEADKLLQLRQDSIVWAVEHLRTRLRTNPEERERISAEILRLENRIFEVRSAKGRLVDRINALEQEWVLAQLEQADSLGDTAPQTNNGQRVIAEGPKVRNLVYNRYFRENLPEPDYAALMEAQRMESQVEALANRYFVGYDTLAMLSHSYEAVTTSEEATPLYARFHALRDANRVLADSLATAWNYVFDNKSYAYGYVLDKFGYDPLLAEQETRLSEAMLQLAELRDKTVSDEMADYFIRKRAALDYEISVAQLLGMDSARDSLVQAVERVKSIDFRKPKIDMTERFFVDYEALEFSKTPKYTAQKPIPESRIYERGTIYRILLGTFNSKRPVSLFKGVYPLSYLIDDAKKWNYYAGGFATLAEAEAAQALLKEKGFQRPEIVVWIHGMAHNLSQQPDVHAKSYRIEIMNTEVLSDKIRAAIAAIAEDAEVSKVGQNMFVVGLFYDRGLTDAIIDAIRKADDNLEIKVAEMAQ